MQDWEIARKTDKNLRRVVKTDFGLLVIYSHDIFGEPQGRWSVVACYSGGATPHVLVSRVKGRRKAFRRLRLMMAMKKNPKIREVHERLGHDKAAEIVRRVNKALLLGTQYGMGAHKISDLRKTSIPRNYEY